MAGMAMWTVTEWLYQGKPTTLGAASGAIAGLATITPAAGFVTPNSAVLIGLTAGLCCYFAVVLKSRLRFDDSLDVVGIHGLGGLIGTIMAGLLATKTVNPNGADGLFYGNPGQLGVQLVGIAVVGAYALVVSFVLLKAVNGLTGLRLDPESEGVGLDVAEHNEAAYNE
jgi:Amt family ammonium transporter